MQFMYLQVNSNLHLSSCQLRFEKPTEGVFNWYRQHLNHDYTLSYVIFIVHNNSFIKIYTRFINQNNEWQTYLFIGEINGVENE